MTEARPWNSNRKVPRIQESPPEISELLQALKPEQLAAVLALARTFATPVRTTGWRDGSKGPREEEISRLMNLRQAGEELGLNEYHVYRAVHEGKVHAVQVGGKGRIYYPEWELRQLLIDSYALRVA